jgi:GntR family transcriptional regulator/MocR family aminotransferase
VRPTRAGGVVPDIHLDPGRNTPLHAQLYDALRKRIIEGRLARGARLASSRTLAKELGVSRFTLLTALGQLRAEGYITATKGGSTSVSPKLPEDAMHAARGPRSTRAVAATHRSIEPSLSRRGRNLATVVITGPRHFTDEPLPFRPRRPPLDAFPFGLWARLVRKQWSSFAHDLLDYGDPAGYLPLRASIAKHLEAARGLSCTPEQIIVTSGSQQAYDILFTSLLDPDDQVWVEEPGYLDIRGALVAGGAKLTPVPVNADGLDVAEGVRRAPAARLVCVSPSHQYPLGVTLSGARREALLNWAESAGAWVIEDDYDSYFRYSGRPLPALHSVETERGSAGSRRVIYVGTFSKTMFPSLRLGYMVVPLHLAPTFANARAVADRNSPLADQAALAAFIEDGHYDQHLRRMRGICAERYAVMRQQIEKRLGHVLTLEPASAGTHVVAWINGKPSESGALAGRIAEAASREKMVVFPLGRYCLTPPVRDALVLGYGGLTPARIVSGVARLAQIVERIL